MNKTEKKILAIKKRIADARKQIKKNLDEQEKVAMEHDYFESLEYEIYDLENQIKKSKDELKVVRKKLKNG